MKAGAEVPERPTIYLLWSMQRTRPSLRAVDLDKERSDRHKEAIENEFGHEFSWVETAEANHLYGHRDILAVAVASKEGRSAAGH